VAQSGGPTTPTDIVTDPCFPVRRGVIETPDGAHVVFDLKGRTIFSEDGATGGQDLAVTFEAEVESYRWLNDVLCVGEGVIDAERSGIRRERCLRSVCQAEGRARRDAYLFIQAAISAASSRRARMRPTEDESHRVARRGLRSSRSSCAAIARSDMPATRSWLTRAMTACS